jgi:cytochrome c553
LGQRILEVPQDMAQFEHRDSRAQFTAYVPLGSVARGEALVKTGGSGKTIACAACHGPELKGLAAIPGIAGRSPSYIVRQLTDFQQGNRGGDAGEMMQPVTARLSSDDMIALGAYLASLQP